MTKYCDTVYDNPVYDVIDDDPLPHVLVPDGLPGPEVGLKEQVGCELQTGSAKLGLLRVSGIQENPYNTQTYNLTQTECY